MQLIGMNPYAGLFTERQAQQGKIPPPGTRGQVTINGDTKEFVVVKIAAGTIINGKLFQLTPGDVVSGTASGPAGPLVNARCGILTFASATATQTIAATALAWCQIYGIARALVSATASAVGIALAPKAGGNLAQMTAGLSASAMLEGISVLTTQSGTALTLINVFLNYPAFSGPPDTNLA